MIYSAGRRLLLAHAIVLLYQTSKLSSSIIRKRPVGMQPRSLVIDHDWKNRRDVVYQPARAWYLIASAEQICTPKETLRVRLVTKTRTSADSGESANLFNCSGQQSSQILITSDIRLFQSPSRDLLPQRPLIHRPAFQSHKSCSDSTIRTFTTSTPQLLPQCLPPQALYDHSLFPISRHIVSFPVRQRLRARQPHSRSWTLIENDADQDSKEEECQEGDPVLSDGLRCFRNRCAQAEQSSQWTVVSCLRQVEQHSSTLYAAGRFWMARAPTPMTQTMRI